MRKHVSSRMLRGIALLVLILAAITLGIRIYLDQALIRHASMVTTEAAPSETREQLIVAETTPVQESEAAEASVDQIAQFESAFAEIRALEDIAAVEQQGSALKEDYTTIAKLWNRELEALGRAITANMTESEKDAYIASASAFLISRNHECMKELDQDKLSVMENIDYLSREIALTRERCYDLLKDYRSYLASF
ncbi:hypothetical protein [Oribacterium sp. P9]|uniref:hypothetical protein n=1 Tax=unclassified Oribacterium TaxID=2629782 RepID=UPI002A7830AD|nr:hypothetical protein [Oribacterium sp.]MDD6519279.1 hypothetical protein [Oribacterium sp.]MDY2854568.1 hypothetical protein [Oliverpabstia sp.]